MEDPADAGERADVVLGRRLAGVSRRVARAMALEGRLRIDQRPAPPSTRVGLGQRLELIIAAPPRGPAEAAPLVILAITDAVIYVDKPAGLASHRLRPDEPLALVDQVVARFPECADASEDPREGGAAHRLDIGTSGVMAIARTRGAWRALREAFADRRVAKLYAATTRPGIDDAADLAEPIGDLPGDVLADLARLGITELAPRRWTAVRAALGPGDRRSRVAVRMDGRPACSRLLPLIPAGQPAGQAMLIAVDLETGHRHQARVHLQALGAPIVGDRAYGGAAGSRLHLHAWRLDLGAALAGEAPIVAPLPADFIIQNGAGGDH